jgi:drug/metabolite transporter (DMT)-like permease
MSSRNSSSVIVAAATTIFFWGSAFAGIRAGLEGYSPAHLAVLRFLVASLVLFIYALLTHLRLPPRQDLPKIFLLGLLGFTFYNLALNIGEQSIPAGPAALLIQTVPIWTVLFATLFLGERLRPWGWLGIAISFSGALVIALSKGQGFQMTWGAALILMAAISSSFYNIIQKRMLRRYRPVEITTYAIWAGTLLLLPFSFGLINAVQTAPLSSTLAVIYLGIAPAALGYATWAYVLSRLPAGRASSLLYGVPVMAFLIAWAWLGETPNAIDLLGGALALGGVVIVNTLGRPRQAVQSSAPPIPDTQP